MDMDELRAKWAEYDRKLETNLRINKNLLHVTYLGKTQSALKRLAVGGIIEAMIHFPVLLWLGSFTYDYRMQMPFFLPGVGLYLFALAGFIVQIRHIALALMMDYNGPIADIQKQLGNLRISHIRLTQRIILTGPLLWVPLQIVLLKGLLGLDAYQLFGTTYLWVNVAVGVAFIPLALWLSKTFVDRLGHLPWVQQFMRDLAGYSLNEASQHLETLATFEEEGE